MRTCATLCAGIICAGAVWLLAASAPAQNLYVSAEGYTPPLDPIESEPSGTIYQANPGETISVFARDPGTEVRGLTFDESGNIFTVSGGPAGNVTEITTGGTESTYASGLSAPFDLAFNSSGDLFVTEGDTGIVPQIVEIAPGGGTPTTFVTGLIEPRGLAFNSSGDLFVADLGTSNILEITPGGTKTVFATGLAGPFGLAFNSAGDLFVADSASGEITEIAPNGMESKYTTGLENPHFLAFDSAGDLFVSNLGTGSDGDYEDGYLTEITPDGTKTDFDEGFRDLAGVAISPVPEPSAAGLMAIAWCVVRGASRMTGRRRHILDAPHTT